MTLKKNPIPQFSPKANIHVLDIHDGDGSFFRVEIVISYALAEAYVYVGKGELVDGHPSVTSAEPVMGLRVEKRMVRLAKVGHATTDEDQDYLEQAARRAMGSHKLYSRRATGSHKLYSRRATGSHKLYFNLL